VPGIARRPAPRRTPRRRRPSRSPAPDRARPPAPAPDASGLEHRHDLRGAAAEPQDGIRREPAADHDHFVSAATEASHGSTRSSSRPYGSPPSRSAANPLPFSTTNAWRSPSASAGGVLAGGRGRAVSPSRPAGRRRGHSRRPRSAPRAAPGAARRNRRRRALHSRGGQAAADRRANRPCRFDTFPPTSRDIDGVLRGGFSTVFTTTYRRGTPAADGGNRHFPCHHGSRPSSKSA